MKLFPDFGLEPVEPPPTQEAPSDFQMNDGIWESLLREPAFENQLRGWIERMASERLEKTVARLESETREKAQREGYEAGLVEARAATESALEKLHAITLQVATEKQKLLAEHEAMFCTALLSLLEKLAVPETQSWMTQVEGILAKYQAEFTEKGRVEVHVAPETLKALEAGGVKSVEGLRWSIKAQEGMNAGDIEIDFGGIGLQLLPKALIEQWQSSLGAGLRKTG